MVLLLISWVRSDVGDDGFPVEPALKMSGIISQVIVSDYWQLTLPEPQPYQRRRGPHPRRRAADGLKRNSVSEAVSPRDGCQNGERAAYRDNNGLETGEQRNS